MSIGKFKKDELMCIAEKLKLVVPDNAEVLDLRELIQESEIYKNDKETYQAIVDCVLEEINDRRNENENRLEIEKIKLSQLEKELEIAKLHNQSGKNVPLQNENQLITTECNIESLIKSIKTLTIPLPLKAESLNLFFQSIEKAFKTKNVPEKLKPEILLNILGEKANNLMIYLREDDLSDYNRLKAIVLKEFQPTPYECLNQFKRAQKFPSESYVQFASRLSVNFNCYCQLREVNDFKSVCAEIFCELLRPGQIYCGDSRLLLQNTVLGYVVNASVGDEVRDNKIHCGFIRDSDLNTILKSFRELKSIAVKNENRNSEESVSLGVFKQRVHFKNDRYEVELPWKRDSVELSDNFNLEKRQLAEVL
ncbi:integrase catalytic domain-containing protein [Trichonephila clavipes]|nr:integrase catalytic domain-containing protein [Trichonephila clavipes]